ncbi:MAG: DUF1385 domain-containing protein [Oscillospiraceae bacterium]
MKDKTNPAQDAACIRSKIGGQALIEGVMMRGTDTAAMACRLNDGTIDIETWGVKNGKNVPWFRKAPFLRGIFNFVISMAEGYKCLMKSADKSMEGLAEEESETKFEQWLDRVAGDKLMKIISVVSVVLGVGMALVLFMYLPALLSTGLGKLVALSPLAKTILEGVLKITIFVGYLWLTTKMKDLRRTYEYHGAEHKTIACYEHGEALTPANVKKFTRFHPRCGTSFLFIVLFISIIVFSALRLPWDNLPLRVGCKLALLPVVVGIAYEIIRIAGRHDNAFTRVISAPGLWIQRLTTREPDERQIEVAIAALTPCIPADKTEDVWGS